MNKILKSIDTYVLSLNRPILQKLHLLSIVPVIPLALIELEEYINVGVLGNTEGYPWGCKCFPDMENYASPEIYSTSALHQFLILVLVFAFQVYLYKRRRVVYFLSFLAVLALYRLASFVYFAFVFGLIFTK